MARGLHHPAVRSASAGVRILLFALVVAGSALPAEAQAQAVGCTLQAVGPPPRQVLRCRDGLTIEAEEGADYTLLDSDRNGNPDAAQLRRGALFVDTPARSGRRSFQIRTPQAIAAVRGTQWFADVAGGRTSIFVAEGRVLVRRAAAPRGVVLGPGQGVDVEPGRAPLEVRRWPPPRVSALLARFGR